MSHRKKCFMRKQMENKYKNSLSPSKVNSDVYYKETQEFITQLEKGLLLFKKHVPLRTVLRVGKYIKGHTLRIKILQLGKVREYKHMVSFYVNKLKAANKFQYLKTYEMDLTHINNANRLETLKNRRKTLEDKEKHQQWDAQKKLEELAKMEPCTSRTAIKKDEHAKQLALSTGTPSFPKSRTFFDKLLLKINHSNSSSVEDISIIINKDEELSSNSSSTEFLGFNEYDQEYLKNKSKNSLSDNLENKSAFISEDLEVFLKENALENCSNITVPIVKFQYEEGMVYSGSEMPTMDVPKQLVKRKARTVAEKRQFLESKKDVKFLMAENESTIYWALQRRLKKEKYFSYDIIHMIQNQDIPIRRDVWKSAAWLATRSGKFYFQSIEIEDEIKNYRINLYGGHGNFDSKLVRLKKPNFKRYNSDFGCNIGCNSLKRYPNLNIDLQDIRDKTRYPQVTKPQEINRLNLISHQRNLKPGPLSSKLKHDGSGELQIFEMPKIQLELKPRLEYEFSKDIKKYLNLILPSNQITEEWAKFAVSTLVEPSVVKKMKPKLKIKLEPMTFTFDIPYSDNQNKVLTRKEIVKQISAPAIYTNSLKKEMDTLKKPLKILSKCIDRNDAVQCEIGNYLKDMFDSAVIGLCQNSIVKKDPDLNYNQKDGMQSQLKGRRINNFHDKKVRKNKSKLLNELRRLNATFIETSDANENHNCNEEHCTLGCVCTDIRKIPPLHCRKEKCMFECTCKKQEEKAYIKRNAIVEDGLSKEDMKLLRDRATCRLAKMEKDFNSTIVLTNDNTILIHNTQVESKRNRKPSKILKGYSIDDLDQDDEKPVPTPTPTPEKEVVGININKYKSIEYMTHCNVVLDKLPLLDDLEVWCMVHCLYKCFCNGTAIKGDVFGFTDVSPKSSQHFPPAPAKRRNYTFDKPVVGPKIPVLPSKPITATLGRSLTNSLSMKSAAISQRTSKTVNKSEQNDPILSRLKIVNCEYYRMRNKAPKRKILKYVNAETKLQSLLKQRVNDCLYSKRLNLSKRFSEVVIVLSESDDDNKDDDVQEILTDEKEKIDKILDSEGNETEELMEEEIENMDKSEKETVDCSVKPVEVLPIEENCRSATPEPDLPKLVAPEPTVSASPLSHRVPVDRFIEFSQQIENGIIKSPMKANIPAKTENVTKLNLIVTKAMSKLCEMQKNNLNDIPEPKLKGFNNISWNNLINIYRENKIFIWEVRRITKSNNLNLLLAVTKTSTMPKIENAISVICVKAARAEDLSVTGKMINLQIMNEKTRNLAVIIYGQSDHWLILGCIHSDVNYLEDGVCVRPTPATHPLLATKINKLNTLLCTNPFILQNRNTKTTPIVPFKFTEPSCSDISKNNPIHKSNIKIVPFNLLDTNSLFLPIPVIGDHRWFMLTIEHDFSDIYIPTWHSFLKYERIVATHKIARSRSKTVRILHMNNEHTVPHVFITPKETNKIFFGPYRVDQDVSMVLCQECDGKMLSREIFEEQSKIKRDKHTTGCWLYVKNNEIVPAKTNQTTVKAVKSSNIDDDVIFLDEVDTINNKNDCILIEDDDDDQIDPPSQTSSPTVKDGQKIALKPLTPEKLIGEDNNVLVKSVDEKERPLKTITVLPKDNVQPSGATISTKDDDPCPVETVTKRKIYSILKPVSAKSPGDSVEIVFNQLKPGQTTAMAVASNNVKQTNVTMPTNLKQVSLLKNHVGKFLKLKPIAHLSIPPIQKSVTPLPPLSQIVPSTETSATRTSTSTQSVSIEVLPTKMPSLTKEAVIPKNPLILTQGTTNSSPHMKPAIPTEPAPQTMPFSSAKSSKITTQISITKTPTSTQPPPSTESSNLIPLKGNEQNNAIDTLVIIDDDKVITKPAPMAARLVNRRKTMDHNTVLNRMVCYNSDHSLNAKLGKRKSNELLDPMKNPLLNTNVKVFKKLATDNVSSTGLSAQEQIKFLLKRKASLHNDDSKITKIRIVENSKLLIDGKSTDAVTKAIQKLSSTSTYIRSHATSTVTSTTVSTTVAATIASTNTSPVQVTPVVVSTDIVNTKPQMRLSLDSKGTENKIANCTEGMKSKDTSLVVSSPDENDPRLNIKAFIVSECIGLGKIPCLINKLNITFQLPSMEAPVTLVGLSTLNQFLYRKIHEAVHSIVPNNLNLKWSIISDRKKIRGVSDLLSDKLNKHHVLTEYGLIDLRSNLENDVLVKSNPVIMVKLLILQLECLLNGKSDAPVTRHSPFLILEKTQAYVKQLKLEETQLMRNKLSLYKEIYHKKNQLSKMTEKDEIITPDTISPPVSTTEQVPQKLLFLQYGHNSSNIDKTISVSTPAFVPVAPRVNNDIVEHPETIVIDDDDD